MNPLTRTPKPTPIFGALALAAFLAFQPLSFAQSKKAIEALMQADRNFALMAKHMGLKEAFTHYADPEAIMLRDDTEPIRGIEAIEESFSSAPSDVLLVWEPEFAVVSKSGDLGYTMGHHRTLDSNAKILSKGTYTTFWKKNKAGDWKWTMDVGIRHP